MRANTFHHSEETKRNLSLTRCGSNNPMYGKHHTTEAKDKIGKASVGRMIGNKYGIGNRSMLGKHHSEDTKQLMSQSHKGKVSPKGFLGKKHKDETKIKISISQSNSKESRSAAMKKHWRDVEFVQKALKSRNVRPNKTELKLYAILEDQYLGKYGINTNAEIMLLGGKIPDFININGQKKLIELFGDYWHRNDDPQDRIDFFKQYGFDTLVIWEHELKDVDKVMFKLKQFEEQNVS